MGVIVEVKYFNSFWLKKVCRVTDWAKNVVPDWPGVTPTPPGYPSFPFGSNPLHGPSVEGEFAPTSPIGEDGYQAAWFVEEMRIKGGFNNTAIDLGVKAYIVDEKRNQEHLLNSLIYSGVYNSRTGINQTNVFSVGEDITKSVDPINGSIQRLYAEDTNLIVFQENKVSRALIDKDTIYTTEGGTQTQAANRVIGQIVPFLGEYGISKNPESFAVYGYRKYFTDRYRGAVLRLSRDGITEISSYGMSDYFRDHLAEINDDFRTIEIGNGYILSNYLGAANDVLKYILVITLNNECDVEIGSQLWWDNAGVWETGGTVIGIWGTGPQYWLFLNEHANVGMISGTQIKFQTITKSQIIGGWDIHSKNFVVSLQENSQLHMDEKVNNTAVEDKYYTVSFDENINGWTSFHSYKPNFLGSLKNKYYSFYNSGLFEHYDETTPNNRGLYYSTNPTDRVASSITFVFNPNASISKNFKTINYEGSNGWRCDYFTSGITGPMPVAVGSSTWTDLQDVVNVVPSYEEGIYIDSGGVKHRAGFHKKENKYYANLVKPSNSIPEPGQIINRGITGIKGYFATVQLSTDDVTDSGGMKELFSVASEYVVSSK